MFSSTFLWTLLLFSYLLQLLNQLYIIIRLWIKGIGHSSQYQSFYSSHPSWQSSQPRRLWLITCLIIQHLIFVWSKFHHLISVWWIICINSWLPWAPLKTHSRNHSLYCRLHQQFFYNPYTRLFLWRVHAWIFETYFLSSLLRFIRICLGADFWRVRCISAWKVL